MVSEVNSSGVVIAEKVMHKGMLFGSVSNGCPSLVISHGITLKLIALNDKFVTVQVLQHGIGITPKNQTWIKSSVSKEKSKPKTKEVNLINIKTDVQQEKLFEV